MRNSVDIMSGLSNVTFKLDEQLGLSAGSNGYMAGWIDQSAAPLAVTITNPPRVVPDNGGEVIFEHDHAGAGQFVDIAGLTINRRAFTLACAMRPHSLYPANASTDEEVLLGSTGDGLVIRLASSGATSTIRVNDSGGFGNATAYYPRSWPMNALVISGDAAACRIMLNGKGASEVAMTTGSVTGFRLGGRTPTATGPWRGRVPDFAIRSVASSFAEMSQITNRIFAKHDVRRPNVDIFLLADSLAVGLHPTQVTDRNLAWPNLLVMDEPTWQLRNYAQSGMAAGQAIGSSLVQTFAGFSGAIDTTGVMRIAIFALGSNDKAISVANSTIISYISTLADQARTYLGAAAVIAIGVTPRNPFTLADLRDYNNRCRSLVGTKLDGFVDPLDDPIFATNDSTNTFRFAGDSTHLNANGSAALYRLIKPEVQRVIAAQSANPRVVRLNSGIALGA